MTDPDADPLIEFDAPYLERNPDKYESLTIKISGILANQGTAPGTVLTAVAKVNRPKELLSSPLVSNTKKPYLGWSGVSFEMRDCPLVIGEKEHSPVTILIRLTRTATDEEVSKFITKLPKHVRQVAVPDGVDITVTYRATKLKGIRRNATIEEKKTNVVVSGPRFKGPIEDWIRRLPP